VIDDEPGTEEVIDRLRSGQLGIRKRPGGDNALGLVKFGFSNQSEMYMHGKPSSERRGFNHGCIRVEDPISLAQLVLRDQTQWTAKHIADAMHGETTIRVSLVKPVSVLIVYGTAVVMEDGQVHFYRDLFGYDAELERFFAKGDRKL
jgi:murein L,D-transpeptidase YcbB/YkuD